MGRLLLFVACCALCCGVGAAQRSNDLTLGTVTPRVACDANPQQSYAVYLPSTYSPKKRWPIIYAFDPGARGQVAVEAIRAAAEKYGYIVVGSNNSRNGMEAASAEAAQAMWQDTQQKFSIDEHRRYFAGMSGGARMASALAMSCNGCVAGVIANAAGFPLGRKPSSALKFVYFAAHGNADFNFLEFVDLRRELEESGMQYRMRVFEGQHGWAPAEVWLEALNWMDLQAMRAGLLTLDPARARDINDVNTRRASQLLAEQDFLAAFREYKFIVRDLSGLTDVTSAEKMVSQLKDDKRLKTAEKKELSAADDQRRLMAEPSAQIQQLAADESLSPQEFTALRDTFAAMMGQARASRGRSDPHTLVVRRSLSGLVAQALEAGQFAMGRKRYDVALHLFDLMVAGSDNPGWGHYHRARAYAALADERHMLAELKLASTTGFHTASALDAEEFQAFRNEPEFQAISREWGTTPLP